MLIAALSKAVADLGGTLEFKPGDAAQYVDDLEIIANPHTEMITVTVFPNYEKGEGE